MIHIGVDIANSGLLVEAVEDLLVLVGGGVRQGLGLLGVLLKVLRLTDKTDRCNDSFIHQSQKARSIANKLEHQGTAAMV